MNKMDNLEAIERYAVAQSTELTYTNETGDELSSLRRLKEMEQLLLETLDADTQLIRLHEDVSPQWSARSLGVVALIPADGWQHHHRQLDRLVEQLFTEVYQPSDLEGCLISTFGVNEDGSLTIDK